MAGRPFDLLRVRDGDPHPRLVRAGANRFGVAADLVRRAAVHRHFGGTGVWGRGRPHRSPQPAVRHARILYPAGDDFDGRRARRHAKPADRPVGHRPNGVGAAVGYRRALGADRLLPALGISRTTSDMARVIGALTGAGLFAAFGFGAAYIVVASFYAVGFLLTAAIGNASRRRETDAAVVAPRPSAWSDLRAGLAYVRARPQLLAAMWLAFLVHLTAYPLSNGLLPYVAREIYLIDQTGLGYLAASFAMGALLGSMAVSQRSTIRPGRAMILATLAWYVALLVFVRVTNPLGGVVMLMLAGFAQSFCMVTLAVLLMRTTSAPFRGRVMGVRMLVIYGLPLGLPVAGALIDLVGFHATATLYASVGLACTLIIALNWRSELWPAEAPANARQ